MSEIILRTENVTQRFGGLVAVNDVSFELHKGEIVGIIGPNGAGKTTFFNDITALGMARTFQNIRLFYRMTALENVMVGMHTRTKANLIDCILRTPHHRRTEKEAEKRALEVLELTGLSEHKYDYATSLPYGLQRRLEIARALATNPEVLLFDEPAAGMNEAETSDLMEFIRQLQGMGYSILLIEHDMRLVMNICERLYVLDHGNLIAQGKPEDIKSNQQVIEAYLGKGGEITDADA